MSKSLVYPSPKLIDGLLLILVGLVYVAFYLKISGTGEILGPKLGWFDWWDQGQYLKSALAFYHLDLSAKMHWYPIGYSLIGAPFVKLTPSNPFLVVNLICFVFYFYYFYRLGSRFLNKGLVFAVFLATLLFPYKLLVPHEQIIPLFVQFIFPWNTTPVAAIYAFLLYQSTVGLQQVTFRLLFLSGLLVGYLIYLRPTDILPLLPLGLFLVHELLKRKKVLLGTTCLAGGFTVSIGLLTILTFYIHGTLLSEYVSHSKNMGFEFFSLPAKFFSIFIDSSVFYGSVENPLLHVQPWLYIAIPLFVLWAAFNFKTGAPVVIVTMLSWFIYLSYNDLIPTNLFRYNVIHYVVWTFPYLAIGALISLSCAIKYKIRMVLALSFSICVVLFLLLIDLGYSTVNKYPHFERGVCKSGAAISISNENSYISAVRFKGLGFNKDIDYNLEKLTVATESRTLSHLKEYRLVKMGDDLLMEFPSDINPQVIHMCFDSNRYDVDRLDIETLVVNYGIRKW